MQFKHKWRLLGAAWLGVLIPITVILLKEADLHDPGSIGKLIALLTGWGIFLLAFTPLSRLAGFKASPAILDRMVIFLLLLAFFIPILAKALSSLLAGNYGTAMLLALAAWGIFNILKELLRDTMKKK